MRKSRQFNIYRTSPDGVSHRLVGTIAWRASSGLTIRISDAPLQRFFKQRIAERISQRQYYIAAAVSNRGSLAGLWIGHVDASDVEVLRCIAEDAQLWREAKRRFRAATGPQEPRREP